MRLTIDVPNDADPVYARQLVKALEEHFRGRPALVMLRRPPGIRDDDMPTVVAKCAAILQGAALITDHFERNPPSRMARLGRFLRIPG